MSEKMVIDRTATPVSYLDLVEDLKSLGLKAGDQVMLHVSMSKIGWIIGGERTLIEAVMAVISRKGTLVMPSQTGNISDPALWENPPVPASWVEKIRAHMPAYDKDRSPAYAIGRVAEYFRTYPGVERSDHPKNAFAAWGKNTRAILHPHLLGHAFDAESPLGRMLESQFKILMIGTTYDTVTALHYAESQVYVKKAEKEFYVVSHEHERAIKHVWEFAYTTEAFHALGRAYESTYTVQIGSIGQAEGRLIPMPHLVAFGIQFMEEKA